MQKYEKLLALSKNEVIKSAVRLDMKILLWRDEDCKWRL